VKRATIATVIAAAFIISASGQGFLNLNFDSAYNLPGNPGYGEAVSATNALPDWTAYDGSLALSRVYYTSNTFLGSGASVGLEGGSLALSGNYSAALYLGGAITQTGMVPANAESLQFEAYVPGASGFAVTLGGQTLSYSALSEGPDYTVYEANIPSNLDGQVEELAFFVQNVTPGVLLDNIEFSTSGVPEPGEFVLIGIGVVLFGLRRNTKRT
jgi:hypothetical protein